MFPILILLLVSLGGCTSVTYKELSSLPAAKSDMGLIYFYRESKFAGGVVSYYIYEGEDDNKNKLGALKSGTFFYIYATPGTHTYWASTEAKDSVTLEVGPAKTYYVKGEVDFGLFAGRPDLTIVHEMEGQSEIPELEYTIVD